MSYTWFKLHHELPDDIKLRRFTPQEKWAWVVLLCLASKGKTRGVIDADDDDIAEYCEFNSTQDWLYFRDKLIAKGMLEIGGSGCLEILHWKDRQYDKPSDRPEAVNARVRKHRESKKAKQAKQSETPCNALPSPCNADETPQTRSDKTRSDKTRSEEKRSEEIKEQECVVPVEVTVLPDSTTRNSCLAPAPKPKPVKPKEDFDEQAWIDAYNTYKPSSWPECRGLNSRPRKDGVRAAIAACTDEQQAIEAFAIALSWIRVGGDKTKFWREECSNPCFEVLLRPTKLHFLGLSEQGMSANVNPEAIAASGMDDSMLAMAKTMIEDPDFPWEK